MERWIIENTNVTIDEYEEKIDARIIMDNIEEYPEYFSLNDVKRIKQKLQDEQQAKETHIMSNHDRIIDIIEMFTLLVKNNSTYNSLLAKRLGITPLNNKNYRIENYNFRVLSSLIVDEDIKQELTSNARYGKCHQIATNLIYLLPDSKLVIGKLLYQTGEKFLHSVLLFNSMIIDYTHNLVMPKNEYLELFNFTIYNELTADNINYYIKAVLNIMTDKNIQHRQYLNQ